MQSRYYTSGSDSILNMVTHTTVMEQVINAPVSNYTPEQYTGEQNAISGFQ